MICCGARRKGGDNSGTPARSASKQAIIGVRTDIDNVTVRSKPKQPPKSCGSKPNEIAAVNEDTIRKIIRAELQEVLTSEIKAIIDSRIGNKIQEINSNISYLKSEFEEVKSAMTFMSAQYDEIKMEIKSQSETIINLQKEVELLKTFNRQQTNRLNDIEQHSRASNIELQCVPEHRAENLVNMVQQLAKVVSYDLGKDDIHLCTRVAKLDNTNKRPRSIIVKLKNARSRDGLLAAASQFNRTHRDEKLNTSHLGIGGDKKPIFVAEHLSPFNKDLHKAARMKAKEYDYKFVWVRSGRVFIRKSETDRAIPVKDYETLKRL